MPGLVAEAMAGPKYAGITGIPTWIVNDKYKIVGAQPFEVLRDAFRKIEAMGQ